MTITYDGGARASGTLRGACGPTVRPAVPPAVRPAGRARLTRRGRLVVVLFTLLLLVVGGFTLGRVSSEAAAPSRHVAPPTITVQPGETLWQVAVRVAPRADPRLVVDELQRVNHLAGPRLLAGQQLVVPRS